MQVAHRSHVISMLDGAALRAVIEQEKPHYIVPEIEAIATATLVEPGGRRLHRGAHRPRRATDHEPRGYPPAGCRGTRPADLALSLRRYLRGLPPWRRARRLPLRGEADHEFVWQGPEHPERPRRPAGGLGLCPGRRARRQGPGDRRGLHRFRLRNHPAHRAPRRRHHFLRADRSPPGQGRLPRVLAAAGDERAGPGRVRAGRPGSDRGPRRTRAVRRRTVRQGRPGGSARCRRDRTIPAW